MIEWTNAGHLSCGTTTVGGAFLIKGDARGGVGLKQDTGAAQACNTSADNGDVEGRKGGGAAGGSGGRGGRGRHHADVRACQR